jgi:hypothetical protein
MYTRRLLTILFAPASPFLAVYGFLWGTKDFRMVIFYNKKLKNSCHLLENRAELLKNMFMSAVLDYTVHEEQRF